MELDTNFSKALRLLHSKSKDSEDQLRQMLEDSIKQKYGSSKAATSTSRLKDVSAKRENTKPSSSVGSSKKEEFRKESEKKPFEKVEESPSSPTPSQPDDDHDGLALEILEEDLTCVVCRGMDVVARNQLVECIECHSLYHQECHQPPVSEEDMNDPRSAWYCSNCSKAVTKMAAAGSAASSSYTSPTGGPAGKPAFTPAVSKSSQSPTFVPTSKAYPGLPLTAIKTSSSKPVPIAPAPAPSTASAAGSPKCVVPNINIISADKRLQIMKKKAAKLQEKRKHSK